MPTAFLGPLCDPSRAEDRVSTPISAGPRNPLVRINSLRYGLPVQPQSPNPARTRGVEGLPFLPPLGDLDSFRQHELFYLSKIGQRLDDVVILLAVIMITSALSAWLLFTRFR